MKWAPITTSGIDIFPDTSRSTLLPPQGFMIVRVFVIAATDNIILYPHKPPFGLNRLSTAAQNYGKGLSNRHVKTRRDKRFRPFPQRTRYAAVIGFFALNPARPIPIKSKLSIKDDCHGFDVRTILAFQLYGPENGRCLPRDMTI